MTVQQKGRTVVRDLVQLRVHPALEEIGYCGFLPELGEAARSGDQVSTEEPIFVTHTGLILAGFGRWRLAVSRQIPQIECVEYSLTDEDALQFMLRLQKRHTGWNPFVRIRLALRLEGTLQQRALTNMQIGGKYKGLANLPEAQRVDVRQEIAKIAGVGASGRNVSSVKKILQTAHPRLISALQDGTLTINRALHFCKLDMDHQVAEFVRLGEDRATMNVIRQSLGRLKKQSNLPDAAGALEALQRMEAVQPGSVIVRVGRLTRTVVLVGQDLLTSPLSQRELKLK